MPGQVVANAFSKPDNKGTAMADSFKNKPYLKIALILEGAALCFLGASFWTRRQIEQEVAHMSAGFDALSTEADTLSVRMDTLVGDLNARIDTSSHGDLPKDIAEAKELADDVQALQVKFENLKRKRDSALSAEHLLLGGFTICMLASVAANFVYIRRRNDPSKRLKEEAA